MITTSNNVVLRNLEEQVQKNKEDIANHYAIDRVLANFGIKVVGQVDNPSQLPDPLTYAGTYGDAYAVGAAAPYHFFIYTRPDVNAGHPDNYWLDVGGLAIVGPPGPSIKGDKGEPGENSTWYAGISPPMENNKEGDMFLQLNSGDATGNIYRYAIGSGWQGPIGNIKGNTGDKGSVGESSTWYTGASLPTGGNKVGDMFLQLNNESTTGNIYRYNGISWQGPIGNIRGPIGIGERGEQGKPGQTFYVVGTLTSTDQLPTPTQAIRAGAYLIPSATVSGEYDMWVIVGGNNEGDTLTWFNAGQVTMQGGGGIEVVTPQFVQDSPDIPGAQLYKLPIETANKVMNNPQNTVILINETPLNSPIFLQCVSSLPLFYGSIYVKVGADTTNTTALFMPEGEPTATEATFTLIWGSLPDAGGINIITPQFVQEGQAGTGMCSYSVTKEDVDLVMSQPQNCILYINNGPMNGNPNILYLGAKSGTTVSYCNTFIDTNKIHFKQAVPMEITETGATILVQNYEIDRPKPELEKTTLSNPTAVDFINTILNVNEQNIMDIKYTTGSNSTLYDCTLSDAGTYSKCIYYDMPIENDAVLGYTETRVYFEKLGQSNVVVQRIRKQSTIEGTTTTTITSNDLQSITGTFYITRKVE